MKPSIALLLTTLLITSCPAADPTSPTPKPAAKMETEKPVIVKTEDDWKKKLTEEQFRVTRERGTERPFGLAYEEFEKQGEGTYYCVCCGAELFTSTQKFHSGCGWPSFYDQSSAKNIREIADDSHGMRRIETVCKRCNAHLGHVFEGEGYKTPTDRRFCINGVALKFVVKGGKAPALEEIDSEGVQKKKTDVAKEAGVEVRK
jgi:peptide-methionine (R)-S-oxide reductase